MPNGPSNCTLIRACVWLSNTPAAIFTPDTVATNPQLDYYVSMDHLNTLRVIFDTASRIRWRWLAEPIGTPVSYSGNRFWGNKR